MKASASSSSQDVATGQHGTVDSGQTAPPAGPLSAPVSAGSAQVTGQAIFTRPCVWCALNRPNQKPNLITVLAENSDGICKECAGKAREAIGLAIRERAGRRLLAEMYTTSAAILVLLPFLKREEQLGWPGYSADEVIDFSHALADLRAAVGDR